MPKLIPDEAFNWVEDWTLGRPFHSLYSHILEVVCDNPGSVGARMELGPKLWRYGITTGCRISRFKKFIHHKNIQDSEI